MPELLEQHSKQAEYAPGIPSKSSVHPLPKIGKPRVLEFGIHEHLAEKAGPHFDLRIGDPDTGHAHSWALRHLPRPGETRLAVQQPTHTVGYMDFRGRIAEGYGAGQVNLARRDKTEVLSSSADHVRFNLYGGKSAEEYLLRRTSGSNWLLHNVTTTREGKGADLPNSKPSYKTKEPAQLDPAQPGTVMQAKIDGAHVLFKFDKPHSQARVFSYRPTERETGVIEHTHRLPDYSNLRVPGPLRDSILRGELYATSGDGKALPPQRVGGILNAGVWKSRQKQEEEGHLRPVVFDVVKWRGRDVSREPYEEKLKLLRQAVEHAPWLQLPRMASTPSEKQKLIEDIRSGKEPSTIEGVVEWHLDKPVPVKSKFRPEKDVFVRRVFPEKGARGLAGGFEYSTTKEGPIVGRVGTGFSHGLKRDMLESPSKYEGLQARIKVIPGHEGRAPAFISWHLDQEIPMDVKVAQDLGSTLSVLMDLLGKHAAVGAATMLPPAGAHKAVNIPQPAAPPRLTNALSSASPRIDPAGTAKTVMAPARAAAPRMTSAAALAPTMRAPASGLFPKITSAAKAMKKVGSGEGTGTAGYRDLGIEFPEHEYRHRSTMGNPAIRAGHAVNLAARNPLAALLLSGMLAQPKVAAVRSVQAFIDQCNKEV